MQTTTEINLPVGDNLPFSKLYKIIQSLERRDLRKIDVESIKKTISIITMGRVMTTIRVNPGAKFYRLRVHEGTEIFPDMSHLWYPRAEILRNYGRANRPFQPLLYISGSGVAVLKELKPKRDQYVTFVTMEAKEELNLMPIGIFEFIKGIDFTKHIDLLSNWEKENYLTIAEKRSRRLVNDFLLKQFIKKVEPTENYKYKISTAIAEDLLNYDDADGIVYPSIASDLTDINFAIKPVSADNKLKPTSIDVVRIDEFEEHIRYQTITASNDISTDGKINYNNHFTQFEWAVRSEKQYSTRNEL